MVIRAGDGTNGIGIITDKGGQGPTTRAETVSWPDSATRSKSHGLGAKADNRGRMTAHVLLRFHSQRVSDCLGELGILAVCLFV